MDDEPAPADTGDSGPAEVAALPLIPLRDNVVFPELMAPIAAGRPRSVAGLEQAVSSRSQVILAVQRDPDVDDVALADLHEIAVVANVGVFRRLPAGGAHALVEGQRRVRLVGLDAGDTWQGRWEPVEEVVTSGPQTDALSGAVRSLFGDYVSAGGGVSPDVAVSMARATDPRIVADIASAAPDIATPERVELLQMLDVGERLQRLLGIFAKLIEVVQLRNRIHEDVQRTITKTQREHILREQLRVIRKELSELEGADGEDEDELAARVEALSMPEGTRRRVLKEVRRLEQIPSASPEMGMLRTWVDWILDLPWGAAEEKPLDIEAAEAILDEDHYGLEKVKERIVEWLAVRQRALERQRERTAESGDAEAPPLTLKTPILCLVGPPGVGKTSLGRSIARALGRPFVRMSLGGIRDEAEIRGHRRTYIGAMPGRILQAMRQAGASNAVVMLDEIDKVGTDFRGDPSAALLEVLDPEQNREFSDHYLEVPYDLSHVLFITTANVAETISPPLRDRMETIRIAGYTDAEKIQIARRHLLPREREQHGLDPGELELTEVGLQGLLRGYTREAGVRQLDRAIATLARKVPRRLSAGESSVTVDAGDLEEMLGPARFDDGEMRDADEVGVVTGVVVSEVGGDIVSVEAVAIEGAPALVLTGQLGSVMEESAQAALSWARVHAVEYGGERRFFDTHSLHVHVPAGAIPKDGPSAGVTMATAFVSLASGRPVRRDVAMTGEVTLRGHVLPIGGLRDKLLAAHRSGLTTFILPRKNERDLKDIEPEILEKVRVVAVDTVGEVLDVALGPATERARPRRTGFVLPDIPAPPPTLH